MSFYEITKKTLFRIIPKSFIFKHELKFRFFNSLLHTGTKFTCIMCNSNLSKFVSNINNSCPTCGSISRERRLWELINTRNYLSSNKILDFSPSRALYRQMKKVKGVNYVGSDLSGNFLADETYDITKIDTEKEVFDLILCYHILEHIIDDIAAMNELYRVLSTDGKCIIQTPFKEGEIFEDYTIITAKERKISFGQEDHVRIYSVDGLTERLKSVGFKIEKLFFEEENLNRNGFKEKEYVLICSK